jgi:hypothetical protein
MILRQPALKILLPSKGPTQAGKPFKPSDGILTFTKKYQ